MESPFRGMLEHATVLDAIMPGYENSTPSQQPQPPVLTCTNTIPDTLEYGKFQRYFNEMSRIGHKFSSTARDPCKRLSMFAEYFVVIERIRLFFKWYTKTDYVADDTYKYVLMMKGLALCIETAAQTNTAGSRSNTPGLKLDQVAWPDVEARFQSEEQKLKLEQMKIDAYEMIDKITLWDLNFRLKLEEKEEEKKKKKKKKGRR